jgi:hypothetical protein
MVNGGRSKGEAAAERRSPCDEASKSLLAVEAPHQWQDSADLAEAGSSMAMCVGDGQDQKGLMDQVLHCL